MYATYPPAEGGLLLKGRPTLCEIHKITERLQEACLREMERHFARFLLERSIEIHDRRACGMEYRDLLSDHQARYKIADLEASSPLALAHVYARSKVNDCRFGPTNRFDYKARIVFYPDHAIEDGVPALVLCRNRALRETIMGDPAFRIFTWNPYVKLASVGQKSIWQYRRSIWEKIQPLDGSFPEKDICVSLTDPGNQLPLSLDVLEEKSLGYSFPSLEERASRTAHHALRERRRTAALQRLGSGEEAPDPDMLAEVIRDAETLDTGPNGPDTPAFKEIYGRHLALLAGPLHFQDLLRSDSEIASSSATKED